MLVAQVRGAPSAGTYCLVLDLVHEGVLTRHQGRGTFVAPPRFAQRLRFLTGFSADMAARGGYRKPLIVAADSPLARRMERAFATEWQGMGRSLAGDIRFTLTDDLSALRDDAQKFDADMIFLATNVQEARVVRPYLSPILPTYATSQAFAGRLQDPANVDLAGVRFIDMPWLLQPDHPAVMIYPRPEAALGAELERLYALGIDAERLASMFYRDPTAVTTMGLDGVTGRLTLGPDHRFRRELVPADFQQNAVVAIDAAP